MRSLLGERSLRFLCDPMQRCDGCSAHDGCVVASLPADTRTHFHTASQARAYGRGMSVFRQGDQAMGIFFLCAGWLKLVYVASHGRAATVALAGPGMIVGLREVLTNNPYDVSAEVLESTELAYVRRLEFLRLMSEHPEVAVSLLNVVSRESGGLLAELCENVAKLPSVDRLLHTLQNLARSAGRAGPQGTTISLPLTVQDLADRVGCSRQWTSKLLADLEAQGMIRRQRGWISVSPRAADAIGSVAVPPPSGP